MKPADFYGCGEWDCSHAYDPGDVREAWRALGYPTDPEAAINVVDRYIEDPAQWRADWIASQYAEDFDGCDPQACAEAWLAGWRARAIEYTRGYMVRWTDEIGDDL